MAHAWLEPALRRAAPTRTLMSAVARHFTLQLDPIKARELGRIFLHGKAIKHNLPGDFVAGSPGGGIDISTEAPVTRARFNARLRLAYEY